MKRLICKRKKQKKTQQKQQTQNKTLLKMFK